LHYLCISHYLSFHWINVLVTYLPWWVNFIQQTKWSGIGSGQNRETSKTGQQAWCFDCSSRVRLELMRNRKGRLQEKAVRVNNKIKDGYRVRRAGLWVWWDCEFAVRDGDWWGIEEKGSWQLGLVFKERRWGEWLSFFIF